MARIYKDKQGQLDERFRRIVDLRAQGRTNKEIAIILNCTLPNVRSCLRRKAPYAPRN